MPSLSAAYPQVNSEADTEARTDDLPITRRMLGVDLDGSRRIWLLRLDALSVQTGPEGSTG